MFKSKYWKKYYCYEMFLNKYKFYIFMLVLVIIKIIHLLIAIPLNLIVALGDFIEICCYKLDNKISEGILLINRHLRGGL